MSSSSDSHRIDDSQWPILVVTEPKRAVSDEEFVAVLDRISAYCARGRFGLVVDVRGAPQMTAARRRVLAERLDLDVKRYGHRIAGIAVVMDSALARGTLKAIAWLRQSSEPVLNAFSTMEEAVAWARSRRQLSPELATG